MKQIYVFALGMLCFNTSMAQTTYQPGEEGNNCTLSIEFDEFDEPAETCFILSMTNPSTPICALSAYFIIDDNTIRPWNYDPVSKSYDVEMNVYSKKNKEGRVTTQSLQTQMSDETNPEHPGYFYVSIAGADNFLGEEGEMAYIYFDATKLSDGEHVLYMKDAFCGSVIGEDIDNMKSFKYLSNDQEIKFYIKDGVLSLTAPDTPTGISNIALDTLTATYDLQGRRVYPELQSKGVSATTPGLYIQNGHKVIR